MAMATHQPTDDRLPENEELAAEHRALKRQTSELVREHERLHHMGGTRKEHEEHRQKLHEKLVELERHAERLKSARKQLR
jgi:hypothetical protein